MSESAVERSPMLNGRNRAKAIPTVSVNEAPHELSRRRVCVLGVSIIDVSMADVIQCFEQVILAGDRRCRSVFLVNAHTLNLAAEDPRFRQTLNSADFVFNDGTGVRWAARQRGIQLRDNLCGTDLVPALFTATPRRGYRYFLLGADRPTIDKTARVAQRNFSGWTLAGWHHGYVDDSASDDVIAEINASGADVLLVGMGNPLQEFWIQRHQARLRVSLAIGVGGLFDLWAGRPRRAPKWIRQLSSEWVYLLAKQPYKWRRYVLGNPKFLFRITRSLKADIDAMKR